MEATIMRGMSWFRQWEHNMLQRQERAEQWVRAHVLSQGSRGTFPRLATETRADDLVVIVNVKYAELLDLLAQLPYRDGYLRSDPWYHLARAQALLDNHTCQGCGCTTADRQLHCHHLWEMVAREKTRRGQEIPGRHLITECARCHTRIHGWLAA